MAEKEKTHTSAATANLIFVYIVVHTFMPFSMLYRLFLSLHHQIEWLWLFYHRAEKKYAKYHHTHWILKMSRWWLTQKQKNTPNNTWFWHAKPVVNWIEDCREIKYFGTDFRHAFFCSRSRQSKKKKYLMRAAGSEDGDGQMVLTLNRHTHTHTHINMWETQQ